MALNIGDAVLTFFGDTSQLDQVFTKLPAQTEAAMTAAAGSAGVLGTAMQGVTFELDATAENAAYAGGMIEEQLTKGGGSAREARGEVALLGELFGIHLPRHVRTFIGELGGVQNVLAGAFAATAIIFVIEALAKGIEKLQEWAEQGHKVELAWDGFQTATLNAMRGLDDKLLETGAKLDDLRGNHMAALRKELDAIDHQSLKELESEFGVLAKAADAMFAQLKASWYEIDAGSKGAQNALTDFKAQYDLLLAEGKKKEASDLLAGTLKSAKDTLATMQAQKKAAEEVNTMEELGGGPREKELKAQQTIVAALEAQVLAQQKINELEKERGQIKTGEEAKREANEAKKAAEEHMKLNRDLAKSRDELNKELEKGADDVSKVMSSRLFAEVKEEEKAGMERLKLLHQQEEGQIAAIDGEMKARQDATAHDADLLKGQYDRRQITAQQYLAQLKTLYNQEVADLIAMLNRKEQLVILEAQNEAAQHGRIITADDAKQLKAYQDLENKKAQIQQEFGNKYTKAEELILTKMVKEYQTIGKLLDDYTKKLRASEKDLQGWGKTANAVLTDVSNAFGSAIGEWESGQESFGAALQKALAQYLIQVSSKAAIDALYFAAWGIADTFWNPPRAGADFAAAAEFAAIAAVAGAVGAAMSGGSAGGRSTGSQSAMPAASTGPATLPAANAPQTVNAPHLQSGGLITRPTLAVLHSNEVALPLSDRNVMSAVAEAIAMHMSAAQGGGTNYYINGMISADNLNKTVKKINRGVKTGRVRVLASDSHKITRRG